MKRILWAAFLIRLAFLVATPFDDMHSRLGIRGFNDELSHIHYVRYLAEHRALPVQTRSVLDADAFEANEFEYYQPPLYYMLAAPAYLAAERSFPGMGAYAIRLMSLAFGLLTVAAAGWAGSAFDRRVGTACAALFALFPTAAYFTAIASNDSLAWLAGALWLGALLRTPAEFRIPRQAGLGLLLGLGILAKSSLLCLAPLVFLKPWIAWRRNGDWRRLLPPLTVCLIAFALALPYYLRNLELYGSPLALEVGAGEQAGFLQNPSWHRVYAFLSWTVVTFWDPFNIPLGFHAFPVKALMVALTAACAGVLLWGGIRPGLRSFRSRRNRGPGENSLLAWSALGLSFAGYLWYNLRFPQSEARLMFHSLAALLIVSAQAARPGRRPRGERATFAGHDDSTDPTRNGSPLLTLYVDADACPVKDECYKVAKRHGWPVVVVANAAMRMPYDPAIRLEVVSDGFDAADDWIVEHAGPGDIVVTSDIPLAGRSLKQGAFVLGNTGRPFTEDNIGDALASRELAQELREMGMRGGPAPFQPKDRGEFLMQLDRAMNALKRKHKTAPG